MKRMVRLSAYSIIVTAICVIVLVAYTWFCSVKWGSYAVGACLVIGFAMALWYMPVSVSADEKTLNVKRPLKVKSIPLAEVKNVQLCPPTMAERRICGSGGWFGYWGRFYEPSIGKYFAYYGKASDCFLVELKNGKKYLLGCEDAPTMVEYLKSK